MFDRSAETLPRNQLREVQNRRLRSLVRRVYEQVPFYKNALEGASIRPDGIESVEDLPRIPFTRKEDLRQLYPFGLLAVDRSEVLRIHASSGTTGKPVVAAYNRKDVELFAEVNARSLAAAGVKPGMLLHNAYGYGLFTGGLGLHYGGERLGLTVLPVSGGMTERQLMLITDFQPDAIACTPSYAQTLAGEFRKRGIDSEEISLQFALLGAEPWTEAIRQDVDAGLGVRSTNIYGLTEIIGPGVAQECLEGRDGSHIWEDHFYPEVVDPKSGEPCPEGSDGVLILTTLTKQAMPLLRYWTGDITFLIRELCACGRTHVRMGPVKGRTDDMLIIRGVNLYPTQIEEALKSIEEVVPHYQLLVSRSGSKDEVRLQIEVDQEFFQTTHEELESDEIDEAGAALNHLRDRIQHALKEAVGLTIQVSLKAPGKIPRSEGGKLSRVIDSRKLRD